MKLEEVTLIIPYYRAPLMLQKQLATILDYPMKVRVVIIDDCSPEPADVTLLRGIEVYRIETDIPWNREGARNLGAFVAETEWIIHVDIDHVLPSECVENLFKCEVDPKHWYKFFRFRVGKADETRKKDTIPEDQEYGSIKPHIDSFLCTKKLYWEVGGYNENYSGSLGGSGPFLRRMTLVGGQYKLLDVNTYLEVYTRDKISDASVSDLSRDTAEFRRKKNLFGIDKGKNPLRFAWKKL